MSEGAQSFGRLCAACLSRIRGKRGGEGDTESAPLYGGGGCVCESVRAQWLSCEVLCVFSVSTVALSLAAGRDRRSCGVRREREREGHTGAARTRFPR